MAHHTVSPLALLLLAFAVSCGGRMARPDGTTMVDRERSPRVIGHTEISATRARSARDLLQRARPHLLLPRAVRGRGLLLYATPIVYVNDVRQGGLDVLHHLPVHPVPPYDPNGGTDTRADIAGRISASQPSSYRVVVYARADLWYRQPTPNAWVEVAPDGTWKTWTHTGASYAAFAMRRDVGLSPRLDVLPRVNGNILGRVIVEGVRE